MELPILELKAPWPLVNVEEENYELVVSFHPEAFLWPAIQEVGSVLLCLVDETDGDEFILDFGNVNRVSGVGLQKLVGVSNKLHSKGRRLMIKNACPELAENLLKKGHAEEFVVCVNPAHCSESLTKNHCTDG